MGWVADTKPVIRSLTQMAQKFYVFLAQDAWFAIAATIAALTLAHISTLIWQRCCRKARGTQASSPRPLRVGRTMMASFDSYAHLTKICGWSLNEIAWVVIYAGSMMLLGFFKSEKTRAAVPSPLCHPKLTPPADAAQATSSPSLSPTRLVTWHSVRSRRYRGDSGEATQM